MPELRVPDTDPNDYKLTVYAPGDGALAFAWVNKHNNQADSYLIVTREDVDNYLNSEQGKHHKDKYKVATVNGQIRLHKPVTRTTPNTLTIDGQAYTYELTEDGKNTLRDDHRVIDSWMNVTFTHEGRTHDLKNWNLRAIIRFFLTHEQTLTTQHGS